jgi:RNA polymerase sigma factor (sigma-70 family)
MYDSPKTRGSLLLRLRDRRDDQAWSQFVEIYKPLIYQVARRKGLQDADAADVVQEVLRSVASAIQRGGYDPAKGSFRPWLYTIVRNLTVNSLAVRSRGPRGSGETEVLLRLAEEPAHDTDSDLFELEYRRGLFHWAIERVRGEFSSLAWQAFWRTGVEGQSPGIVAEALGTTIGTVYYYKSRVIAKIRRAIESIEGDAEEYE